MRAPQEAMVLFVCTANLCRSPLAEHIMRARLGEATGWVFRSAGTHARIGDPVHLMTSDVLADRGSPVSSSWRTSELTAELIKEADLILVAETSHRAAVIRLVPGAIRRTFVLLEFAALAQAAGLLPARGERHILDELMVAVPRARSQLDSAEDFGLEDPYGRRRRAFEDCADIITLAADRIGQVIGSNGRADQ